MDIPYIGPLLQNLAIGTRVRFRTMRGLEGRFPRRDMRGTRAGGYEARTRLLLFYMVQFDAPQHDLSEDGPYYKAQILGRCLAPAT